MRAEPYSLPFAISFSVCLAIRDFGISAACFPFQTFPIGRHFVLSVVPAQRNSQAWIVALFDRHIPGTC